MQQVKYFLNVGLVFCVVFGFAGTAGSVESQYRVAVNDCDINGFRLYGSLAEMLGALGIPDSESLAKSTRFDKPHAEYHYRGLKIVFAPGVDVAIGFFVSEPHYRLRAGIGVGSTLSEVENALGPGFRNLSASSVMLHYAVDEAPAQLMFTLKNDVVTAISVRTD
jgi:hypothetical protein